MERTLRLDASGLGCPSRSSVSRRGRGTSPADTLVLCLHVPARVMAALAAEGRVLCSRCSAPVHPTTPKASQRPQSLRPPRAQVSCLCRDDHMAPL